MMEKLTFGRHAAKQLVAQIDISQKKVLYFVYRSIHSQICQIWQNLHIWAHISVRQIWSSEVSLKRSFKMQFRRIGNSSIGPSSHKL